MCHLLSVDGYTEKYRVAAKVMQALSAPRLFTSLKNIKYVVVKLLKTTVDRWSVY